MTKDITAEHVLNDLRYLTLLARSFPTVADASTEIINLSRICERYGTSPEDVRKYDVYRIDTAAGQRILKKASQREIENYITFLIYCQYFYKK